MREQTKNGVTLRYQDEIGFAFNVCLIEANGVELSRIDVAMSTGEQRDYFSLYSFGGKCYCDVRDYVQAFFDTMGFGNVEYSRETKTDMSKDVSFEIVAVLNDGTEVSFTFNVFYIWGALKVGGQEVYNGFRTLTWFKGYPFTFGMYAAGGGSVLLSKDGVANRFVSLPEKGVWNVPMLPSDDGTGYYLISDSIGNVVEATFDTTFDITFKAGAGRGEDRLRINVVDGCEGLYLRWVNRHGFYCYYLFKVGDEQRKSISDGIVIRNNLLSFDSDYGYKGGAGRLQQMSREDVVSVCAPLVDGETWDMLFDITTSPIVDLFAGYKDDKPMWVSVTIAAGNYTKSRADLQDFVCNVVMPEVDVQKL